LVLAVTFEVAHSLQTSQAQDFLYLEGRLSDCDEGPAAASVIAEDVVVMKRPECRAGEGDSLERKAGYSGSIRWQAFRDPRWEIETRHPGFNSPEDAALYTAGFGHAAVEELELLDGGLHLRLTDGTALQVSDSDVRVWHAAVPVEGFRPETADFQQIPITAAQLACVLAPTPFVPLLYDVIGPTAERMPFSIQAPDRPRQRGGLGVLRRDAATQETGGVLQRTLGCRQADALQRLFRCTQRLQPFEGKREVGATFVWQQGVYFIDDHGAYETQRVARLRGEQQVE
jgi:hypothetical protein